MLDNKGDLAEAGPVCVIKRKINNRMTGIIHSHDLLEPAEAAAHAGGKDDERGLLHINTSVRVPRTGGQRNVRSL